MSISKKGFSLIEVLIFVSILSIFLVSAATIITVSMRQNEMKIYSLKASHYNDQLLEWIRSERERDWTQFVGNVGNSIYCFKDDAFSWVGNQVSGANNCNPMTSNSTYKRYASFITTPSLDLPTQVDVTVFSEWAAFGNTYTTKLHTLLTVWE